MERLQNQWRVNSNLGILGVKSPYTNLIAISYVSVWQSGLNN